MKELSIEQKAQAYDEAFEKTRLFMDTGMDKTYEDMLVEIFPELAESEDEKIKKGLISYFGDFHLQTFAGLDPKKILAWLEKQGEPTEINPSEFDSQLNRLLKQFESLPKEELASSLSFYLNVVQNDGTYKDEKQGEQKPQGKSALEALKEKKVDNANKVVVESKFHEGDWVVTDKNNVVQIKAIEGSKYVLENTMRFSVDYVDKCWRKWTIQDVKDGDVLYSIDSKQPFIYKERLQFSQAIGYCCINKFGEFAIWNTSKYVICTDKYIPATKEQRDLLFQKMHEAGYEWDAEKKKLKRIEQKPVWSEEDEMFVHGLIRGLTAKRDIHKLTTFSSDCIDITETINWLKSLKDRFLPQPKQEWSEEDERVIKNIIYDLDYLKKECCSDHYEGSRDRNPYHYSELINWLKSLRPQKQWKPDSLQLQCLEDAINRYNREGCLAPVLVKLLEQLKEL